MYRVVLVTAPSEEKAKEMARKILEEKLCACVNINPGILSMYWWEGKIQEDGESLMIIKTRTDKMEKLIKKVKEIHPYTVPEIIALPILEANEDYLNWIKTETEG